jgi:hypothetical protein
MTKPNINRLLKEATDVKKDCDHIYIYKIPMFPDTIITLCSALIEAREALKTCTEISFTANDFEVSSYRIFVRETLKNLNAKIEFGDGK